MKTLASLVCFSLASSSLAAQVQVAQWNGENNGDAFGSRVVRVGDVDGDGRDDLAVSEPFWDGPSAANSGRVRVFSGATHALLWSSSVAVAGASFGAALASAGDFDSDGVPDLIVGSPFCSSCTGGRVYVLSGVNGGVLLQLNALVGDRNFGAAVACGQDLTGDGAPDILVGAPTFTGGPGFVRVYDGQTGAIVRTHTPSQPTYFHCGWDVEFLTDVNGDGVSEYVFSSNAGQGLVEAHDGATGALLWEREGAIDAPSGDQLGYDLVAISDQNFDGRTDLVATAPQEATTESFGQGYALVLDGRTGAEIARFGPAAQIFTHLGDAATVVEDIDGDGREDIALAAPLRSPRIRIFSVASPTAPRLTLDVALSLHMSLAYGDVSGDGLADLVVGASGVTFPTATPGEVRAFSLVPAPATYCEAEVNSLGCTPTIGSTGAASVSSAQPFVVSASNLLNQKTGLVFYGFAPQQTPFAGGSSCIAPPRRRTPHQFSGGAALPTQDCSGVVSLDFNAHIQSGVDPLLIAGRAVFAQVWSRDPADPSGTNLSDALAFPIGL